MSPTQLDLTEFVSKLIHDTFNAIAISSKEQAEIYFELTRLAALDYETFTMTYIKNEAVDDELSRLFPLTGDRAHPHAIHEGAPYSVDTETHDEQPDLKNVLGYETDKKQRESNTLTAKTVTEVRDFVRDLLARQHYTAFKEIVRRGIPRVIIDSGRILAKLSLKATETDNGSNGTGGETAVTPHAAASSFTAGALNKALISRNIATKIARTRIDVSLPDPSSAGTQTTASLWGEVEIKFRTVD
jgi:hypothetical protein